MKYIKYFEGNINGMGMDDLEEVVDIFREFADEYHMIEDPGKSVNFVYVDGFYYGVDLTTHSKMVILEVVFRGSLDIFIHFIEDGKVGFENKLRNFGYKVQSKIKYGQSIGDYQACHTINFFIT